jgi:tripartite-type tricarboxylate transporter receptor subunit TctC
MMARSVQALAAFVLALTLCDAASAQSVEQFYHGRTVNLIVPSTPGGLYDISARLVGRHLGRFIPGKPSIVVQNQPGAAGVALGNRFAATAEKDGSVIAVMQRALPQFAFMGDPNAKFDPLKLNWLGSLSSYETDAYMLVINASHPARTAADLRKPGIKAHLGANRAGSTNLTFALLTKEVLKLNVEVVRGFPGATDIMLAQQRGEVDAQTMDLSAIASGQRELWTTKQLRPLVQFGRRTRLADLPDVPTGRELVSDAGDLALLEFAELPFFMALPFAAPADVPPDRVAALQKAFSEMSRDGEFLEDAKRINFPVSPIDAEAVGKLLASAAATPSHVLARFKTLLGE